MRERPMRAMSLTQPWCGLVASGIKTIENRSRQLVKPEDFGKPFGLHATAELLQPDVRRIIEIAHELCTDPTQLWWRLASVLGAIIAVATIDDVVIRQADGSARRSRTGEVVDLGDQRRWFFGPVGYLLRDIKILETPVKCRGHLGFWTMPVDVEAQVDAQLQRPA